MNIYNKPSSQGSSSREQEGENSNTRAIAIFTTYILINVSLTGLIAGDIWSRKTAVRLMSKTETEAETETETETETKTVRIRTKKKLHTGLTVVCIAVTWFYMVSFFGLSYRSWAYYHRGTVSGTVSGMEMGTTLRDGENLMLGAWLRDSRLFREAWEVVVETPGRFFWSAPIFFVTGAWSFWIAWQAALHRIPHAWAYMVLGQLAAISFAMNLFFLAVLAYSATTPPSSSQPTQSLDTVSQRRIPNHQSRWSRILRYTIQISTTVSTMAVPQMAGTKHFLSMLAIPHLLLLLPPMFPSLAISRPGNKAGSKFARSIWLILLGGLVTQLSTAWNGLHHTDPLRHTHRHSAVYPAHGDTSSTGVLSILRSLTDHPAVSSVGWDSVLCIVSICMWRLV